MQWTRNSLTNGFDATLLGIGNTFQDAAGIDKEVDGVSMQKGILSQIVYPTGGNTKFEYEPHFVKNGAKELDYQAFNVQNGQTANFTLSTGDFGKYRANIEFKLNCAGVRFCNGNNFPVTTLGNCTNFLSTDTRLNQSYGNILVGSTIFRNRTFTDWQNKICPNYTPIDYCTGGIPGISCYTSNKEENVSLGPGLHTISTALMTPNNGQSPSSSIFLELYRLSDDDYKYSAVGGLRIAKIINTDINGSVLATKRFSYVGVDNLSSGILLRSPQRYSYGYTEILRKEYLNYPETFNAGCPNPLWYVEINSQPIKTEGSSSSGQIVGYSRVIVTEGDSNTPNGTTIYEYENAKDVVPDYNAYYDTPSTPVLSNGMVKAERYYTASNQIVKEIIFENALIPSSPLVFNGFKYLNIVGYPSGTPNPNGYLYAITYSYYKIPSQFWYNSKKTDRIYDPNNNFVESITTFVRHQSYYTLPKQQSMVNSKGETNTSTSTYPVDFTDATSLAMKQKNIIDVPLETTNTLTKGTTTTQLSYEKKTYNFIQSKYYLPIKVETQQGAGPLFTAVTFDSYDVAGNLLSYTSRNGLKTTLTYFGSTDIGKVNFLKSQSNNLGHITTYDYLPLIGVSTITDPNSRITTYIYDTFNRLSNIKDPNGKIVKSYQYNYYNQ